MAKLKTKIRRGEPTIKQIKALQNINAGMSVRRAMIEAGYSVVTATKGTSFFKHKNVQKALLGLKGSLENVGITNEKIAIKFAEWIDAQKPFTSHTEPDKSVPDYETQIKAYDRIKDIWGNIDNGENKIKRKLTIEEFVNEEPQKLEEVKDT